MPVQPLPDGPREITQQPENHHGLHGKRHTQHEGLRQHMPLTDAHELRQK